jgi:hypothetical protein
MAQQDGIGNASRKCIVRRADDDIIFHVLIHGMIVTNDNQVVAFLFYAFFHSKGELQ